MPLSIGWPNRTGAEKELSQRYEEAATGVNSAKRISTRYAHGSPLIAIRFLPRAARTCHFLQLRRLREARTRFDRPLHPGTSPPWLPVSMNPRRIAPLVATCRCVARQFARAIHPLPDSPGGSGPAGLDEPACHPVCCALRSGLRIVVRHRRHGFRNRSTEPSLLRADPSMTRTLKHATLIAITCMAAFALPALAVIPDDALPALSGARLPLLWGVPFAGLLLSIALVPLVSRALLARALRQDRGGLGARVPGAVRAALRRRRDAAPRRARDAARVRPVRRHPVRAVHDRRRHLRARRAARARRRATPRCWRSAPRSRA